MKEIFPSASLAAQDPFRPDLPQTFRHSSLSKFSTIVQPSQFDKESSKSISTAQSPSSEIRSRKSPASPLLSHRQSLYLQEAAGLHKSARFRPSSLGSQTSRTTLRAT